MAGASGKKGIDSRDRTLGLFSIDDMFKKLLWEIGEFTRLAGTDESPNLPACYMAQNAAATAWHMGEWLSQEMDAINYWEEASKRTGKVLTRKQDLQAWMRDNLGLMACEQIADATKHVQLFPWVYRDGFSTESRFFNFYGDIDGGGVVTKVHGFEEVTSPIPKVVLMDGPHRGVHELEPLLDQAATWWNDLLATIRYTPLENAG